MVLTLRLHARLAAFTVLLLVFALLPFLATSSQGGHPRQALLLSAEARAGVDAPAVVQGVADGATASARQSSELEAHAGLLMIADVAAAALQGQSTSGEGGGFVLFPTIDMASMSFQVFKSPVAEQDGFIRPIAGPEVSAFGPRMHPVLGRAMFHTGIDLMAACGTPIRAAAAGTVEYAENSVSWGNRTIIAHSPTLKTAYGHQSKFLVHEGEVVAQGQIIGLVGTTGWSTGCHLHWDVILNGRYVDPRSTGTTPSSAINGSPAAATPIPDGDVPIPIQTGTPTRSSTGTPTGTTTGTPTGTTTGTTTGTKTGTPGTTTTSTTAPAPSTSTTTSTTTSSATTPPAPTTSTTTSSTAPTTSTPTSTTPSTSSSAPASTEPTSTATDTPSALESSTSTE